MSCQPRPQPQASGIAASTASSGIATNTPIMNRSRGLFGSGSMSGRGVRVRAAPAGPAIGGLAGPGGTLSVMAVIVDPRCASGAMGGMGDAYVTVTYETVGCARP